ncbi:hypothetical protein [Paenibacillus pabuli]|uniref:hypothetical protein n=1 Tax=Paenibacillus pabuli TaxID=1472 RepID=UPI001FFF17FC|nr:hypothetical protein [Paenibacillus pabuli]UPK42504.1 hypothetical protein KET34_25445 [Paenibacillus pabuli]
MKKTDNGNKFAQKRLEALYAQSHEAAFSYIEIVTNSAFDQMKIECVEMDPSNIDVLLISRMAAKKLNTNANELYIKYKEMMLFEGMITEVAI